MDIYKKGDILCIEKKCYEYFEAMKGKKRMKNNAILT